MGVSGNVALFYVTEMTLLTPDASNIGLLPLLKSIHRPAELKKFSGETLAVDAYGWLHRGAISCAVELVQGKPTRK
jgi:hypothetical protein